MSRLLHAAWQKTPLRIKTWEWRRHERRVARHWGTPQRAREYAAEHGLTVHAGPFAGMRFPADAVEWEQCPLVPALRGSYEREIQPHLGTPPVFIDVGSAYGYYLVGMALRGARCFGFEIDAARRRDSLRLAKLNGVADRVSVHGMLRPRDLDRIPLDGATLLCDIEGAERELFTADLVARLRRTKVIVEFHGGSDKVVRRALSTHDFEAIRLQPRDDVENEHRATGQYWGVFEPTGF